MRYACFVLLLLILSAALPAQKKPEPVTGETPISDPQFERNRRQRDPLREEWEKKLEKRRNQDRHESLKRDTDELLKLATELKEYVDKTNADMLSVDVIDKAEEIEKLAKKVRNKMKGY